MRLSLISKLFPVVALSICLLAGCGKKVAKEKLDEERVGEIKAAASAVQLPSDLFVDKAPDGVVELMKVKADGKEGDEVVIRGQIGGTAEPFVDGRATMTVCDLSVKACNLNPDDKCEKPWDMCCDATRFTNSFTLQVNGPDGKMLKTGMEGKNGIYPLSIIVVKGKIAARPDEKSLVIIAENIFVEKEGLK